MIAKLFWKEWRECRWKMVGTFAVYLALVVAARVIEPRYASEEARLTVLWLAFLMPGVVAMGTIADERVRGTWATLRTMPVGIERVFFIKFLAGLATIWLPLLATEAISRFVLFPVRQIAEFDQFQPLWVLSLMGLTMSLYVWILAIGARLKTELGVGLAYVAMLAGCVIAVTVVLTTLLVRADAYGGLMVPQWASFLFSISPIGFARSGSPYQISQLLWITPLQAVTWVALLKIACWRFSHVSEMGAGRPTEVVTKVSKSPLTSRRHPVMWKSWRESRRLVVGYLILAVGFIAVNCAYISHHASRMMEPAFLGPGMGIMVGLPGVLAMIVAILLGTDVGMRESERQLESFWQSRAIPGTCYFRRRIGFGLLFLLPVMLVPPLLVWGFTQWELMWHPIASFSNNLLNEEIANQLSRTQRQVAWFLWFYAPQAILLYVLSVMFGTFSRRRIIPLVLSFGAAIILQLLFTDLNAPWILMNYWLGYYPWATMSMYFAAILAPSGSLAWIAVKSATHDWRAWLERGLEKRAEVVAVE